MKQCLYTTKYIPYLEYPGTRCLSPRWNWVPPTSLPQASVYHPPPPPPPQGGRHAHLRGWDWGSPNSDDWRKSLAICLLCVVNCTRYCYNADLIQSKIYAISQEQNPATPLQCMIKWWPRKLTDEHRRLFRLSRMYFLLGSHCLLLG
jgi:hypothetical protein